MGHILKLSLVICLVSLTSCDFAEFTTTQGIETLRNAADITARTAIQGPCAITLGAAQRELTARERELAILISETSCGKADATPLTDEERQNLSP